MTDPTAHHHHHGDVADEVGHPRAGEQTRRREREHLGAGDIGGQFNLAKRIPGKEEFHEPLRYFRHRLEETGVDVRLGTERGLRGDDRGVDLRARIRPLDRKPKARRRRGRVVGLRRCRYVP